MNAVDTNVLIYIHDPRDPRKQQLASECVATLQDGVLIWQVACEYLAASRKLSDYGYRTEDAWADLFDFMKSWTLVVPTDRSFLDRAHDLMARYSLSTWDAILLSQCVHHGIEVLYTEDMGGAPEMDGVRIIDPFAEA